MFQQNCATFLIALSPLLIMEDNERKRKRAETSNFIKKRKIYGQIPLLKELNFDEFKKYHRMDRNHYNILLDMLKADININKRNLSISLEERLSLTLRFLGSRNSFGDLKFLTAISESQISRIVLETCEAIIKHLKDYIKLPKDEDEWKRESDKFAERRDFPHCVWRNRRKAYIYL